MARVAKAHSVPQQHLAGASVDVSRIEHETLIAEVLKNHRRIDRLEGHLQRLNADLAELKRMLTTLQSV
jgi:hypothetical protein